MPGTTRNSGPTPGVLRPPRGGRVVLLLVAVLAGLLGAGCISTANATPRPAPEAGVAAQGPCTGEDCIPQPGLPQPGWPGLTPPPPGSGSDPAAPPCGITQIDGCVAAAVNTVFQQIVDDALSPVLAMLGATALSTPTLDQLPGIGELWNNSWQIVLACYSLLILLGGILVMSHESVQSRYSIKEIGPRIPLGFFASALSLFVTDKAIRLANALSQAVLGQDLHPPSVGATLGAALQGAASGGIFVVLLRLILIVLSLALVLVYVIRVMITMLLILSAPLFLMGHCLPQTDPLAKWWWKALGAVLAIQLAQALVLITMVRTMLSGAVHLFGATLSGLGMLLIAIAMGYILFKVPFWLLKTTKVSSGRSLLGGMVKTIIAAKTFGALSTATAGFGGTLATRARRPGSSGQTTRTSTPSSAMATAHTAGRPSGPASRSRGPHRPSGTAARSAPRSQQQHAPSGSAHLEFQQPEPEVPTRDPARTPPEKPPTMPAFRSATPPSTSSTPAPTSAPSRARPGRPPGSPQFRSPTPTATASAPPPGRPRPAPVPKHLQFQPPTPENPVRPVRASTPPATPTFRPATRDSTVGDARPRTPSRPPNVSFQPPPPAPNPPRSNEGEKP